MSDKTWKAAERKIAALLGGRRVPVTGRGRGDAPDIEHEFFSLEVKHRKELPSWILEAMEQASKSAKPGQIPVVILHQRGMKYEDCLTICRLGDIIEKENK